MTSVRMEKRGRQRFVVLLWLVITALLASPPSIDVFTVLCVFAQGYSDGLVDHLRNGPVRYRGFLAESPMHVRVEVNGGAFWIHGLRIAAHDASVKAGVSQMDDGGKQRFASKAAVRVQRSVLSQE